MCTLLKQLQIKHAVFEHKLVLLSLTLIKKKANEDASLAIHSTRVRLSFKALGFPICYSHDMEGCQTTSFDIPGNLVCECKCDGDSLSAKLPKDCGTVAWPTA